MRSRSGLSFVDVLIILAIALLLAALAIPRFVQVPDYGNEEDDDSALTNAAPSAVSTNETTNVASALPP
jgi:Tfp pilus assembly protein FimT